MNSQYRRVGGEGGGRARRDEDRKKDRNVRKRTTQAVSEVFG